MHCIWQQLSVIPSLAATKILFMYQTIDFYKVSAEVGKQKPFQDPKTERVDWDKPLRYTISLLTPDCKMS